jgi:hypothetical protein
VQTKKLPILPKGSRRCCVHLPLSLEEGRHRISAGRSPGFWIGAPHDSFPRRSPQWTAVGGLPSHSDGFAPESHRLPFSARIEPPAELFSCVYDGRHHLPFVGCGRHYNPNPPTRTCVSGAAAADPGVVSCARSVTHRRMRSLTCSSPPSARRTPYPDLLRPIDGSRLSRSPRTKKRRPGAGVLLRHVEVRRRATPRSRLPILLGSAPGRGPRAPRSCSALAC